ncbi:MAG TPA: AAA-like domain-containing protein [Chloroflexia bacterium]|nr:AAA-like domain-containing protein [Chloroflexia bacterium]
MSEKSTQIYTVGGTVQAGEGVYLPRSVDAELLKLCQEGTFAYILSPRQSGKSSLMIHTARQLEADGVRTATLDLTLIGTQSTHEEWYYGVVEEIHRRLQLRTRLDPWWDTHEGVGATQRLVRYFEEVVLAEIPGRTVIFVDEIDTTLNLTFTDDFFIAIRGMHEARAAKPAFSRLSFVLIGVATPGDLIRDPKRTPFNIGRRVDMPDFTLEGALPLAAGLRLPDGVAERVLGWALTWTGGHPYLTQRLCQALAQKAHPTWSAKAVADVVADTFFGLHSERDNNLQFVRNMLTIRAPNRTAVLETYQAIRRGRKVADEEKSLIQAHLKLSGVVRREGKVLRVRNRIYETVFDGTWLKEQLPRVGLWALMANPRVRVGAAAVLIYLVSVTILAVVALNNANIAETRRQEAEQAHVNAKALEAVQATATAQQLTIDRGEATATAEAQKGHVEDALRLATNAENLLDADPELSILLAMNAISTTYRVGEPVVPEAEDALHHALLSSALRRTFDAAHDDAYSGYNTVAWNRDGDFIVADNMVLDTMTGMEPMFLSGTTGTVRSAIWSPVGRKVLTISDPPGSIYNPKSKVQIWDVAIEYIYTSEPYKIIGTLIGTLDGHAGRVNVAIWSPDGSRIATTGLDGKARIWDAASTKQIGATMEHAGDVYSAAWSPDGAYLVTSSYDELAKIWDGKSGQLLRTLKGHTEPIGSVDWSPDGMYIATASNDGLVKIWNARGKSGEAEWQTLNVVSQVRPGVLGRPVNHVAWSPNRSPDRWDLVTASSDGTTTIWSLEKPSDKFTPNIQLSYAGPLRLITWSPNGRSILGISEGPSPEVNVWDVHRREGVSIGRSIGKEVRAVSWSPNSEQIVTANGDGTVRIWASEQQELPIVRINEESTPVLSPDGERVAFITDKTIRILDAMSGQQQSGILEDNVANIAWSLDGQRIISSSHGGTLKLWDASTGLLRKTFQDYAKETIIWARSPDDMHIASVSADGSVLAWNLETGQAQDTSIKVASIEQSIKDQIVLAWSPDSRRLVISESFRPIIWNVAESRVEATPDFSIGTGSFAPKTKISWSPNGLSLISNNRRQGTVVWDTTTWRKRAILDMGEGSVITKPLGIKDVAWSPDGLSVATVQQIAGEEIGTIRVWNADNWSDVPKVLADNSEVGAIVWSPDGLEIASMNKEGLIRIWDVATGRTRITLQGPRGSSLAWSQDDQTLSALSSQGLYHYALTIPKLMKLAEERDIRELTTAEREVYLREQVPTP